MVRLALFLLVTLDTVSYFLSVIFSRIRDELKYIV